MGTIQIKALRFALNLSRSTSNDTVRKCANAFYQILSNSNSIKDRIKDFPKSWYKNSIVKNPDV